MKKIYLYAILATFASMSMLTSCDADAEFDGGTAAGAAPVIGNGWPDGTRPSGLLRRQNSLGGCVLYRTPGTEDLRIYERK